MNLQPKHSDSTQTEQPQHGESTVNPQPQHSDSTVNLQSQHSDSTLKCSHSTMTALRICTAAAQLQPQHSENQTSHPHNVLKQALKSAVFSARTCSIRALRAQRPSGFRNFGSGHLQPILSSEFRKPAMLLRTITIKRPKSCVLLRHRGSVAEGAKRPLKMRIHQP